MAHTLKDFYNDSLSYDHSIYKYIYTISFCYYVILLVHLSLII